MSFTPLAEDVEADKPRSGFVPLRDKPTRRRGFTSIDEEPSSVAASVAETLAPAGRTVRAMVDPVAVAETAGHLATGAVAMPVAGLAGLGAAAAKAFGADVDPAQVVHKTAEALTYAPKTKRGEHLSHAVLYPLERLAEGARHVGEQAQDAGASPGTSTAIETAILGVLPLAVPGAARGASRVEIGGKRPTPARTTEPAPAQPEPAARQAPAPEEPAVVADKDLRRPGPDPAEQALADQLRVEAAQRAAQDAQVKPVAPEAAVARAGEERPPAPPNSTAGQEVAAPAPRTPVPHEATQLPEAVQARPAHALAEVDAALREWETTRAEKIERLSAEIDELMAAKERGAAPKVPETPERIAAEPTVEHPVRPAADRPVGSPEAGTVTIMGRQITEASPALLQLIAGSEKAPLREAARAELLRREGTERPQEMTTGGERMKGNDDQRSSSIGERESVLSQGDGSEIRPSEARAVRRNDDLPAVPDDRVHPDGFTPLEAADATVEQRPTMSAGAQHVGFINDAAVPTTHTPVTPIRREDILAPLAEALNAPLYEGRIPSQKVLGFYVPGRETVRIKRKSDLETTAHEIAHLIDDRAFNGFGRRRGVPKTRPWEGSTPEAKAFAAELRGVSYDRSKIYEGYAEFVRLWMTQPEKAMAAAPKFSAWFDSFVKSHEYGPALMKAREGMTGWFGQDALSRARSKIGEQPDVNAFMEGALDRFRQSVSDDLHGVYRMERELKGGIEPRGAYETARLTRAASSITEGALMYGTPFRKLDGSFGFVGKGLREVLDPVTARLDDFMLYAVGRSAKELMVQGREHLFTTAEIRAMTALETPEFRQAFEGYQKWNEGVLDFAEQLGLISGAVRARWQRTEYVPFHRVGTGTERARGGVSGNWSGIKTLTGGTENIRDVLGNIIGNAAMLIDAALKNDARLKIADMAEKTIGGGRFMAAIPPESKPVKIDKPQLKEKLIEAAGGNPRNPPPQLEAMVDSLLANAPYLIDLLVKGQAPAGGNVVAVLKHGQPRYYEVADPILYRALTALDRPVQSTLLKWLSMPKRIGQASIVLTPDFAIRNIARDTLMGAIMSRSGFRPAVDSIRGLMGRMNSDPSYVEYIANGGGFSSFLVDEAAFRHHLAKFYEKKGFKADYVLDAPSKFLTFVERVFDAFEVSTRLGEYKRLREQGVHPRHAAYLGREVSTDFAMKGDSRALGFMYDTTMFLRPAVVSLDRIYRGLAHDPNAGAIAAKSGAVALASAGLYMLNRDNPKFQDLPDWDRDAYWHFFVPTPDGGELHFRYPRIWEVGALATLAERSVERTLSNEPKELAKDFGRAIRQSFMLPVMPQALAPIYEQATNKDSFTGRPIETQGMENLQPFLRAKSGTSETFRALGMASRHLPEALQVNPARAEALLTGYLNTWAIYGLMLSDEALFHGRKPERRLDQMPVVKSFYRQEPPLATKYEEQFYEMRDEARRLRGTMRKLDRLGQKAIADEIEGEKLATKATQLERVEKRMAAIRAEIAEVRASDLTPAEKRERMEALQVEKNALVKGAVLDAKR